MASLEVRHQELETGFAWWALGIAIFGGFMLGAHIAMQIGISGFIAIFSVILLFVNLYKTSKIQ